MRPLPLSLLSLLLPTLPFSPLTLATTPNTYSPTTLHPLTCHLVVGLPLKGHPPCNVQACVADGGTCLLDPSGHCHQYWRLDMWGASTLMRTKFLGNDEIWCKGCKCVRGD